MERRERGRERREEKREGERERERERRERGESLIKYMMHPAWTNTLLGVSSYISIL